MLLARRWTGGVSAADRDLEPGDVPATLGEPDGLGALAGPDVEDAPGREPGDLGDECAVGLPAHQLQVLVVFGDGRAGWAGRGPRAVPQPWRRPSSGSPGGS